MLLDDGYRNLLPLLRDKAEAAAFTENSVTLSSLVSQVPSRSDLFEAVSDAFSDILGVRPEPASATQEELALADELAARKYSRPAWNEHAEA